MHDVYSSLTPEKRKADGTMTTILFRPLSYPIAWLALNTRISPNAVTYLSALGCIAAFVLALFPSTLCHVLAMILFIIFAVLDCADGNMARTLKKKNLYGGCIDAAGGYLAYATELTAIGLTCFYTAGTEWTVGGYTLVDLSPLPFTGAAWIILGCAAALANTLMRLFHQAFKNAEILSGMEVSPGKQKRFSEEVGITGYLPILYIIGFITNFLPAVLILYTIIYCGGFAVSTLKLIRKAEKRHE